MRIHYTDSVYINSFQGRNIMDISKLTQKAQEALQAAQVLAVRHSHQQVDGEHMLSALIAQEGGLVPRLVERMGASLPTIVARLEQ
jgi:ATP-dependent Clp protease ATP-binding subunit ClpB